MCIRDRFIIAHLNRVVINSNNIVQLENYQLLKGFPHYWGTALSKEQPFVLNRQLCAHTICIDLELKIDLKFEGKFNSQKDTDYKNRNLLPHMNPIIIMYFQGWDKPHSRYQEGIKEKLDAGRLFGRSHRDRWQCTIIMAKDSTQCRLA